MKMKGENCPIDFETTLMKPHNEVQKFIRKTVKENRDL